jgi:glycogen(starch) synthase
MISGVAYYAGGVENVVKELSNYLVAHDVGVTVFGTSNRDFVEVVGNWKTIGVRPYDFLPRILRFAYYDKIAYSFKVWRKIRRLKTFDIIHGHADNCLFPSLFRSETPFLMTFHGLRGKSSARNDPRLYPILYAEKVAASKCDVAVACSNAVKKELIDLYDIKTTKIAVIHNGVDIAKYTTQDKTQARLQLHLPVNRRYGLWVGADPIRKGLSIAMKAVEGVPNTRLLVVGIRGKNRGKTVFLGKLTDSELIAAYNAADFLIFPTAYEGFPVVPMEAMACGLPIIVSKESNMGEIITDGVHGLVIENRDSQPYRENIEFLLNNAATFKNMSVACRQLAMRYSWRNQSEKYCKLYRRFLKSEATEDV